MRYARGLRVLILQMKASASPVIFERMTALVLKSPGEASHYHYPGETQKDSSLGKNQANGNGGPKVPRRRDPGAESWRQKRTGPKLKVFYCTIKNRREKVY